jgi:hypothetical protein
MIFLPGFTLNQVGHSPGGPQTGVVAQSLRTCLQAAPYLLQLGWLQARLASSTTGLLERSGSVLCPRLMPTVNRLPMNAQASGHFCLANTLIEELGGFQTTLFQLRKLLGVALYAFRISHARRLA